jgi:hypothetical protein
VNDGQSGAVCPQCGSAAAVHSIGELAALARNQLGQQPGYGPAPPGGFGPPPPPGYQGPPPPGYTGSARPGQPSQSGPSSPSSPSSRSGRSGDWPGLGDAAASLEDGVADVVLGAAARFVGRAISRRVQRTVSERVLPALAVRQEAMLREQIAIAERHPDLRACLTDQVVFLAGGHRVLPMPSLTGGFTVEQSDAVVARLRDG